MINGLRNLQQTFETFIFLNRSREKNNVSPKRYNPKDGRTNRPIVAAILKRDKNNREKRSKQKIKRRYQENYYTGMGKKEKGLEILKQSDVSSFLQTIYLSILIIN